MKCSLSTFTLNYSDQWLDLARWHGMGFTPAPQSPTRLEIPDKLFTPTQAFLYLHIVHTHCTHLPIPLLSLS